MAKTIGKLSAVQVTNLKAPGMYGDGGNLWLQIGPNGTKSWVFRYTRNGKGTWMGLGPISTVSLAKAREAAAQKRQVLLQGKDPVGELRTEKARNRLKAASAMSFKEAATKYIDAHKAAWKGDRYLKEWTHSLKAYAYPHIGDLPVGSIDTPHVLKVLEPIWTKFPVAASRVRSRIEAVLDWAKARGLREGENSARWRGHLENLLPRPTKVRRVVHYPALPYQSLGGFIADLRSRGVVYSYAIEFAILTACRSNEMIGAQWAEIDLAMRVWTIPAERMKSGREHRVPLSDQALVLLKKMRALRPDGSFVFPHPARDAMLPRTALVTNLRLMGFGGFTVHGFRATFRNWVGECTNFAREVAELALAHSVGDLTESAYFRSDLFAKRAKLMQAWADFCDVPSTSYSDNVVPIASERPSR